ncbi:MAG: methyl-accepting chemotaxis protein [Telluria sp.]
MGFAWKGSTGVLSDDKHDGAEVVAEHDDAGGLAAAAEPAAAPVVAARPEAQPAESSADAAADASPLSIGGAIRRKGGAAAAGEDVDNPLPFIGHLSLPRQLRILLMVFGAGILLTIFALWRNAASNEVASAQTQIASDALMHSQRIGKAAPNAVQGNAASFAQLQESRAMLTRDLNLLSRGGQFAGQTIPAAPGSMNKSLAAVRAKWVSSDNAAGTILKMKPELTGFEKTFKQLDQLSPMLLSLSDELLTAKMQSGGSARELAALGRMMMLTQRMARSSGEFLTAGGIRAETAFQLGKDTTVFRNTIDGFLNGSAQMQLAPVRDADTRDKVVQLKNLFDSYQDLVSSVLKDLPKFAAAKAAEQSIFYENEEVRKLLTDLQSGFRSDQDSANIWLWVLVVSSVLTLAVAGSISRVMLQDSRNRSRVADQRRQEAEAMRLMAQAKEEEAKSTNEQNQAAILRLMNELQEVADGDLTVHATVSEDITGAIADSVNYTVEELRGLVERVTATAEQVTSASSNAQEVSTELLSATEQQSREIQEASSTVLRMAGEINDVSRSANESADVARQSVAAAQQGSTAVENAIKGMHEIREQIQETSKRIKRLGESSQEIGEITELISDITEQTNVLALNAAIQAASAGEAGRGFSVVAEEVQRLAERSGDAAKQIGALVRTIQTDTHDAVAAMEKSTQGVVEGARLSDAAGAALSDISRVSNRLAELIQGISFATELQATSANGVAHNMQHILSVTEHTQDGTQQTAQSIRQLSVLAQELKNSVSRFRIAA